MTKFLAAVSAAAFVLCILFTNQVTAALPMIPVGFGLMATAGTFLAGFTFVLRDSVQDAFRAILPDSNRWVAASPVLLLILVGATLSYFLSSPELAVASGVAFLLAETSDLLIYTPLREKGYYRAAVASNVVGAVVDTAVFLYLAQGFLNKVDPTFSVGAAWPGQVVGKIGVTLVFVGLLALVNGTRQARRAVAA